MKTINYSRTGFCIFMTAMMLFIAGQIFAQEGDKNQTNEQGQRTGYWIIKSDDGITIEEEGIYLNGKKEGLWKAFYPNETLKHEITYINGIAKGPARFFYKDGTLWEEGNWQEYCWVGEYRLYHPTGNAAYKFNYNNQGRREGKQQYFYPDGTIKYDGTWDNGAIAGQLEVYDSSGQLALVRNYKDGNFENSIAAEDLMPENQQLDPNRQRVPFHGTGYHTVYKMNGDLYRKGYFREGILHNGEEYMYDDQNVLRQIRTYENGKIVKINPVTNTNN